MKKRVLAGMLIALAVCSVTACGKDKKESSSVVSGSVISSAQGAESQTPETSQAASQTPEAGQSTVSQTPETSPTASQTPETGQTNGAQTVSASISLEEDMASVSYVLLARMISDYGGSAAFDGEKLENGDTFWKEMNYLVSAYGVNNKNITFDEESKEYSLKKAQLRYYAAALYSDLGKAKKLPDIADGSTSVTKKGSKWKFGMNDTSAYDVSVQSCSKQDKDGTYKLDVYLVDAATQTSLGEYAAEIKKSPYKGSKSPFHYTIVSLSKMTKIAMETVLVGEKEDETQDTTQAGLTAPAQTSSGGASGTTSGGGSQYGSVLSMPGTSADANQTASPGTSTPSGTDTAGAAVPSDNAAGQTSSGSDIPGASINSDSAMEIAKRYYGASSSEGTEYQYTYEGTTTYQNVPYYNFSVSDGTNTIINVLVSGDGARIYKGTNTNNSWSMQ